MASFTQTIKEITTAIASLQKVGVSAEEATQMAMTVWRATLPAACNNGGCCSSDSSDAGGASASISEVVQRELAAARAREMLRKFAHTDTPPHRDDKSIAAEEPAGG